MKGILLIVENPKYEMQIVHGAIKIGRSTIFVTAFRRMHCIKREIHFVPMMLEHLMQKHDLQSFLSHSAGSVRDGWMGESSLAVQVSWGNACVVIMTLQAPEFSEHLEQSVPCLRVAHGWLVCPHMY